MGFLRADTDNLLLGEIKDSPNQPVSTSFSHVIKVSETIILTWVLVLGSLVMLSDCTFWTIYILYHIHCICS